MSLRVLRTVLAACGLGLAAWAGLGGGWPWRPRPALATPTLPEILTYTADTLRRGETLSELFARQGVKQFALEGPGDRALFDRAGFARGWCSTSCAA